METPSDKARVWFLGVFCIAAAKEIPHGTAWAGKILGAWEPPKSFKTLSDLAKVYRRPLYHLLAKEKIHFNPSTRINAIMTGVRIVVNPVRARLTHSEQTCVREMMAFLEPTLLESPDECQEAVHALVRTVLREKDTSVAA
jgi:hypothetical protein